MRNKICVQQYQSPVGELVIGSYDGRLCLCDWNMTRRRQRIGGRIQRLLNAEYEVGTSDVIVEAIRQLNEYFAGERMAFDIPVLFAGTDFQCRVWEELTAIPFGATVSYAELARRIGQPKAVRAVANSNAANAISIFVPCHRVIGANNTLTGYAGGLEAKQFLLQLEGTKVWPSAREPR